MSNLTPKVPYQVYVVDNTSRFSVPTLLSDMLAPLPNSLALDANGKLLVVPSNFELTDFSSTDNSITLSYTDNAGDPQSFTTNLVNTNAISIVEGPNFATNPSDLRLKTTVNGVDSNLLDISTLVADINVDSVSWDQGTFMLTLTETSPDGGVTPGQVHNLNLASLVAVNVADSITGDGTTLNVLKLVNDETAPGNSMQYGTFTDGTKGWFPIVSSDLNNTATIGLDGGVFVGRTVGVEKLVTYSNSMDLPLDYIGNPSVNLYAPNQFREALDPVTQLALKDSYGNALVVGLWSLVIPPSTLVYANTSLSLTVDTAMTAETPTLGAGGLPVVYTVTPALPLGLVINPANGSISGTPTVATASASYVVKATNASGFTTSTLTIEVV